MRGLFRIALTAALAVVAAGNARAAGPTGDFALGVNAEGQACRAVERFDAPRGARSVDIYCGQWELPSGRLTSTPASWATSAMQAMAVACPGAAAPIASTDFTNMSQVPCAPPEAGKGAAIRRFGLIASRGDRVLTGSVYPADWSALVEAARVLAGVAPEKAGGSASDASTPGLREIEAVYPGGAPGQGAAANYELMRRRAFEHNLIWSFASSERDFEELLTAHEKVSPDDVEGRADILAEIGVNLSNEGRFTEAADTLARAEAQAKAAGTDWLVGKIENYRALDDLNQHRYAEAIDVALAANRVRATAGDQPTAATISALDARIIDGETPAGERNLLLQFDDTTPQDRAAILSAQGFYVAGVAARALGLAEAETYLGQASAALAGVPAPPAWLISAIGEEDAEIHLAAGDFSGAAARSQTALTAIRLVAPQSRNEALLLLTLSRAEAGLGQNEPALADGRAALAIFAHQTEAPGLPVDLASGYLGLLYAQWDASKDPALTSEQFETLALVWDGAAARSAAQLAARLALSGDGKQARAYQDAERTYRDTLAERQRTAGLTDTTPAERTAADAAVADAAKRFAAAEDDLRSVAPGYLELLNPRVATADLQAALGPKEGYLRVEIGQSGGFGALVTANAVHPFRIALTVDEIDRLTARIRRSTMLHGHRLPDYDIDAALKLYDALLGPVAADLGGLTRLDVDAPGSLAAIPFAALVETPPDDAARQRIADDQDYSGVAWLARRVTVANALGPASFVRFRKAGRAHGPVGNTLAAFGDFHPDAPAAAARIVTDFGLPDRCRGEVDRVLAAYGPLPQTADEARGVADLFPGQARLRLGAAFTDADFLHDPSVADDDLILLATHGLLNVSSCLPEPALLTSLGSAGDGLITASSLLDRQLKARLVILSACDSAGGGGLAGGGEALSGLARGFLYAGVADVMATEWKVDADSSSAEVRTFLTRAQTPGANLFDALGAAQASLYDQSETAHPFYWAAFILVGDGEATIGRAAAAP